MVKEYQNKHDVNRQSGIWFIVSPVKKQIIIAMVLSCLAVICTLGALSSLAWAIYLLLHKPHQWPFFAIAVLIALTILAYVFRLSAFNQSHYAAFKLETFLRTKLSIHLAKIPLGYVNKVGAGALAKILMDDVKDLHVFVADSIPLYARAYISPILTFILLWYLDWRLALMATIVLLLGAIIVALAMRNNNKMMQEYSEAGENVSQAVVEYVQAMPVVRTFDTGTVTFGRYQKALEQYKEVVTRWYKIAGGPSRLSQLILSPLPTLVALAWLGVWLISQDSLGIGIWIITLLIGTGMAESLLPIVSLKHLVAKTEISIRRISEVMAEPVLSNLEFTKNTVPKDTSITFEKVSFRYTDEGSMVLQDISFDVAAESIVALVGPSGAGKSTIARLIPRFWDVTEGKISIGGVDVRSMSADRLMQQVAFVFQDAFLFADTLASNIRLGSPNATIAEVISAAKAAQAHDFITALPNGYDTEVGERGTFLSGGQRQRVTIARAILQNRPILILDEATSFTDPENERDLITALSNLIKGKTVFIVAHRLSMIKDVDQILVFNQGQLVENGKHDQLIAKGGIYGRLWRNYTQAQGWVISGENK